MKLLTTSFSTDFAGKGWSLSFEIFGLACFLPKKIDDWMMEGLDFPVYGGKGKILWKCASCSFLWCLWKERNSRIF